MDVQQLLRKYNLRPRHKLGQNFLVSTPALQAVLDAAELRPTDTILEIGPGLGVLTRELTRRAQCVTAVELDSALASVVRNELSDTQNLHLHEGDILKLDHASLIERHCASARPYKVVANLPYYITSFVLRRLLETEPRPELIVVMVQKEVAERALATPPNMNLLSVAVQLYGSPEMTAAVPAAAFLPRPEVDSAILRIRLRSEPLFTDIATERFFEVASAGFGQKRKGLINALSSNLGLQKKDVRVALEGAQIEPLARAQELTLEDWARLCQNLPNS